LARGQRRFFRARDVCGFVGQVDQQDLLVQFTASHDARLHKVQKREFGPILAVR
jgi:hypothetical protein